MKKSIKINLGGLVLHVDEDAYDLLRHYLDQIQLRFSQVPGESEILNDIETRMAELFQEKLVPGKEVINLDDAKQVIEVMGKPEEIGEAGEEEAAPAPGPVYRTGRRRIFRDPANQRIAGVCGGLAAYFKVDPLLIRILFVVITLAYGTGILIYLALWLAVPEARTAADKLEMYGEEVNVFNIERQVRSEYKGDPDSPDYSEPVRRSSGETVLGRIVRAFGRIILVFIKVIGMIIAFSFIIAGIAILGAIIGVAVSGRPWLIHGGAWSYDYSLNEIMGFFISPVTGTIAFICLILLVAIPLFGLIFGVLKVIFRFRTRSRVGAVSLSGIWFIALIILIVLAVQEGVQYSSTERVTEDKELVLRRGEVFTVKSLAMDDEEWNHADGFNFDGRFRISHDGDSTSLMIRPDVRIEYSEDSTAGIHIRKTARGANYRQARDHATQVGYSYQLKDSVVVFDPVYRLSERDRFHAQEVEVTINLPRGTRVYLDPTMKYLLEGVRNTEDSWSGELVGKEWIMTPDGLAPVLK